MTLYPPIEPFQSGFLKVDAIHDLYYEVSGNPEGEPIVFLHGGPGSRTDPKHRQYFDPSRYKIILFDQRGCGHSTPFASLENNTTWHLVDDLEKIRSFFSVESWTVFGGSWGSTLALTYAITHPSRVKKLILRGIFLGSNQEIDWFYHSGAKRFYPSQWEQFAGWIPQEERHHLLEAYYKRLTSEDPLLVEQAAIKWSTWELTCVRLGYDKEIIDTMIQAFPPTAIARIEVHYFINKCFFPENEWILKSVSQIENIPITIIQGRYDLLCPPSIAYQLAEAHGNTHLSIIQEGGHSTSDPKMLEALIRACDSLL